MLHDFIVLYIQVWLAKRHHKTQETTTSNVTTIRRASATEICTTELLPASSDNIPYDHGMTSVYEEHCYAAELLPVTSDNIQVGANMRNVNEEHSYSIKRS